MTLKAHLITVLAMLAVLLGAAYLATHTGDDVSLQGKEMRDESRFVQIVSASWGMNCNKANKVTKNNSLLGVPLSYDKNAGQYQVRQDNALLAVTKICNASQDPQLCSFEVSPDVLGFDPAENCYKTLEVGYRCFSYDKLWVAKVEQGNIATIDCRNKP